ncbi:MAG: exodeoxyribonuclease VII small subunit [Anaerolineae bacterium]|jgi:exodeoxyribonuclease VII small subunit|nr:exodeoxyribonuclease VII small subunit [Anaerolineae bacterium]
MSDVDQLPFETAYAELQQIVTQLESGELPLDDSVSLYERGRVLSAHCQSLLDQAELRVTQLAADGRVEPL